MSQFICHFVGMAYPMWASFKAIDSVDDKDDDTQWLMYWVVFVCFLFFEKFADFIVFWIPFYYEGKLLFLIVLQHPTFKFAGHIYKVMVRPYFINFEPVIDEKLGRIGGILHSLFGTVIQKVMEYLPNSKEKQSKIDDNKKKE